MPGPGLRRVLSKGMVHIDDVVVAPVDHALWDGGDLWFEFSPRAGVVLSVLASESGLYIEVQVVLADGERASAWVSHGLLRPIADEVEPSAGPVGPVEIRCATAAMFRDAVLRLGAYPISWAVRSDVDVMLCPISTAEELFADEPWSGLPSWPARR